MNTPDKDRYLDFEALVDSLVQVAAEGAVPVEQKINALERLIERWRIARHKLVNPLEFEEFEDWKWFAAPDKFHFVENRSGVTEGSGTSPIRLQRKLLVFLLLHHGQYGHVLEIIDEFIEKMRPSLSILDFKKTRTGVFRCYTNTRFAAVALRDSGLLKFTRREAYKTWVLSLPGFLVAARALASPDWMIPAVEKDSWHKLDPFILECSASVSDYPTFVATLKNVCAPNAQVFVAFEKVLQESHRLLQGYWTVLGNRDLANEDRVKLSQQLVEQLDNTFSYGDFLNELSACIRVEDLLRKADASAKNP